MHLRSLAGAVAAALAAAVATAAPAAEGGPFPYVIVNGETIPQPLAEGGDAAAGAALAREQGCFDCHAADGGAEATAPSLPEAAERLSPGRLRLAVVDYAALDPTLVGHAWYDVILTGDEDRVGRTRLRAREIEDLVRWLVSLDRGPE